MESQQKNDTGGNPDSKLLPDLKIAKLAAIGLGGLLFGCVVIFWSDTWTLGKYKSGSVFHEIKFNAREILTARLPAKMEAKEAAIRKAKGELEVVDTVLNNKDSLVKAKTDKPSLEKLSAERLRLVETIEAYKKQLVSLRQLQEAASNARTDSKNISIVNNALRLSIEPDAFFAMVNRPVSPLPKVLGPVPVLIRDTANKVEIAESETLPVIESVSDIRFINKYPAAGVWLLLQLAFFSFSAVAVAMCHRTSLKVPSIIDEKQVMGRANRSYLTICLFVAIAITICLIIWVATFYDEDIIQPAYFMANLDCVINVVTAVGYLAGVACLGGFIYTSGMLAYFSKKVKAKGVVYKTAWAAMVDSKTKAADLPVAVTDTVKKEVENDLIIFRGLKSCFETYFLFAATILTLMVLCTGSLFTLTNSLDFIKAVTASWGYSPAQADFVFLYGGLHTLLLLLVYIPARMRFAETNLELDKNAVPTDNKKLVDLLKSPLSELKGMLVVTAPLLGSLIQTLINAFFS